MMPGMRTGRKEAGAVSAGRWAGRLLPVLLLALAAGLAMGLDGDVYDTDQAAILSAALVHGAPDAAWPRYEWGRVYGSHTVARLLVRALPFVDPVLLTNGAAFGAWWCSLLAVVFFRARRTGVLGAAAVFSAAAAPAWLMHGRYFSPNLFSAAFLLLAHLAMGARVRRVRVLASPVLFFCAAACRLDALLVLPVLAWAHQPRAPWSAMVRAPRTLALAGAGAAALGLGLWLEGGSGGLGYGFFFRPRVFAAYAVFGLGASAPAAGLLAVGLLVRGARRRDLLALGGAAAVAVPFAFYAALMFSTRHWTAPLAGLLIAVTSRRGLCLLDGACAPRRRAAFAAALWAAALVPLFAGVSLPDVSTPRLTVARPTLFPTADGLQPMGAILPVLFDSARADHMRRIWRAARDVEDWAEDNGAVPLLDTPMVRILELAVRMRGATPVPVALSEVPSRPFLYADVRTLLRGGITFDRAEYTDFSGLLESHALLAQAGKVPWGIVRMAPAPDAPALNRGLREGIAFFGGAEFWTAMAGSDGAIGVPALVQGAELVLWADGPFSVSGLAGTRIGAEARRGGYEARIPLGRERRRFRVEPAAPAGVPVRAASAMLPGYMHPEAFIRGTGRDEALRP